MARKKNGMERNMVPKVSWKKDVTGNWPVYLMFLPAFLFILVLHYIPLFGIVMAFENYSVGAGFFGSEWVGLKNFITLFTGEEFLRALRNTVCIALLKNTVGFIAPVVFAFLLSMLRSKRYKRTVQTCSYLPNFIATVIVAALVKEFLASDGPITLLISRISGAEPQNWLANNHVPVFWIILLLMGIWQSVGWGSIMYVAAISNVNGDLHEAAAIDGATRLQRLVKITLPCIKPTIIMMFVLNVGTSFLTGFDSILLLYMPTTYNVADTLYTYTYRMAFTTGANYGLSAASGLFQSVVATLLLIGSNALSKRMSDMSLF